jgi:hypothetical protein
MLGLDLVRPLEDDWRATIDEVARARGFPTTRDVAALGARVADLSRAYNDPRQARSPMHVAGAARLGFSFARDVPKGAAAVRELVACGVFAGADRVLRVLDLGAGLGAMTWGLARALSASGASLSIDAHWVDTDSMALDLGQAIVRARAGRDRPAIRVRAAATALRSIAPSLGVFDVVLVGHVLSELDVGVPEPDRVSAHADLLRGLLDRHAGPSGLVVVVEPGLRDRSRHLHRVRDVLAAWGITIHAPCLHAASCPALERETDWCHEDIAVDLPDWLVPVARSAGLRREGLTFSYLVIGRSGPTLRERLDAHRGEALARVVSAGMPTKGKRELFLCGDISASGAVSRARAVRLDRDETTRNAAWSTLARGEVLAIDPPLELARARVGPQTILRRAKPSNESR